MLIFAQILAFTLILFFLFFQPSISQKKWFKFNTYRPGKTLASITQVTPDGDSYVSTYYDVFSLSKSQRYLAVTKNPKLNRVPHFDEMVDVCVIDLHEQTIEKVFLTKAWEYQVGVNLEWRLTDHYLYTNDVAVCVEIDLETQNTKALHGPKYNIPPDGSCIVGFPLELLNVTQQGYGYPSISLETPTKLSIGASTTEGIWRTNLKTNKKTLLVSLADVASTVLEPTTENVGFKTLNLSTH